MDFASGKRFPFIIILLLAATLLSIAVTYAQINSLGIHFIRVQQEKAHLQMLEGTAGNPWQYRILADAMVEPLIKLSRSLGIPQPESFSFITFRFLQCILILAAAGIYYTKLGLGTNAGLLGLSALAWGMSYSLYNSDLSFNVYFDVAFYLLAAILILERRYLWLVLLMIPAALNRETSVLIPFLLFFSVCFDPTQKDDRRKASMAAGGGVLLFAVIFVGLRLYYRNQQFLTADGYTPGIGLLVLNLTRSVTWGQLLITLGILPILALWAYRAWPRMLQITFWVILPAWVGVHFLGALVAETRLFLVPQALVFIPGALFAVAAVGKLEEADKPG